MQEACPAFKSETAMSFSLYHYISVRWQMNDYFESYRLCVHLYAEAYFNIDSLNECRRKQHMAHLSQPDEDWVSFEEIVCPPSNQIRTAL
jgi:hypothetical protein